MKIFLKLNIALLICVSMSSLANAQWLGSDLSYTIVKDNKVEVTLYMYFLEGSRNEIPKEQRVFFFEALHGPPRTDLKLFLDSGNIFTGTRPVAIPCLTGTTPGYMKVMYKGTITLPPIDGGYDLVWQTKLPKSDPWQNMNDLDATGVSLVCSVSEKSFGNENKTPFFSDPPSFFVCPAKEFLTQFGYSDLEKDTLVFSFTEIFSTSSAKYPKPPSLPGMQEPEMQFPEVAPPYKSMNYAEGYSAVAPFGKAGLNYKKETQLMTLNVAQSGFYLVGMSLTEFRGKQKIAEVQRVFRLSSGMTLPQTRQ